jgi:hypothetical protein
VSSCLEMRFWFSGLGCSVALPGVVMLNAGQWHPNLVQDKFWCLGRLFVGVA